MYCVKLKKVSFNPKTSWKLSLENKLLSIFTETEVGEAHHDVCACNGSYQQGELQQLDSADQRRKIPDKNKII